MQPEGEAFWGEKENKKIVRVNRTKGKASGTFCTGSECYRTAALLGLYRTYSYCAAGASSWSEP